VCEASNTCGLPFELLENLIKFPNHGSIVLGIITHNPKNLDTRMLVVKDSGMTKITFLSISKSLRYLANLMPR
jgi:hypothetical protein